MLRKKIIFLLMSSLIVCCVGCTPIEDKVAANVPKTSTVQPMTVVEYTNKVNRSLLPLISTSETLQSHHLEILKDKYPIKQEMILVNKSLLDIQKTIGEINNLYVTREYMDHKRTTIQNLNYYRDAIRKYKLALQSKDKDKIKSSIIDIKNSIGTLKISFSLYER